MAEKKHRLKKQERYAAYRDRSRTEKEKPADFMGTAKKLMSLLKGKEIAAIFTVFCAAASSFLSILGPKYLGDIINVLDEQVKHKLQNGNMDFAPI